MTLIDVITALVLFGIFLFGFSQVFLPAYNAWNAAVKEYSIAYTIQFIAESFRIECAKPEPDMEYWRKITSAAKELESYTITELRLGEQLLALKATCIIAGERIEIIGLCAP